MYNVNNNYTNLELLIQYRSRTFDIIKIVDFSLTVSIVNISNTHAPINIT